MTTPPITYIPDFLTNPDYFEYLKELAWVRRDNTPRMEYYINSVNVPYTYGKGEFARTYEPQPMDMTLSIIKASVEVRFNTTFEVCFLNRYLNQKDHLGWHSDNSPEMDDSRPIAIVSFGVERDIWFRPIGSSDDITKLKLGNGSLCLMAPGMQDTHQHRIPKASFHCGERISLTFRGYNQAPTGHCSKCGIAEFDNYTQTDFPCVHCGGEIV
jgi:alkylated DNA repair dioxygenase AlkB